jgi:hypothetical protein
VMDVLDFEYPDYERFDKGAEGLKRKRIVSILNRQAGAEGLKRKRIVSILNR